MFAYGNDHRLYSLARIGSMSIDKQNIRSQTIMSLVVGYQIPSGSGFYIEGEINIPLSGGGYDTSDNLGSKGQIDIYTFGTYGAYRYVINDSVYAKAKVGAAYELIENEEEIINANGPSSGAKSTNSIAVAGGVGLGFVLFFGKPSRPVVLEIEVSSFDTDITMYTIGMTYPF